MQHVLKTLRKQIIINYKTDTDYFIAATILESTMMLQTISKKRKESIILEFQQTLNKRI